MKVWGLPRDDQRKILGSHPHTRVFQNLGHPHSAFLDRLLPAWFHQMLPPPASSPVIRSLRSIYRDDRGDFEELLDYGGFRYHLLLKFNPVDPTSPENIP